MTVDCRDVAGDACTMVAAEYGGGVGANEVMELTMRCVAQTCTTTDGKVEIGLLNASGQRMSHGYDWGADQENAALAPVAPVAAQLPAPVCLGVVGARCLEMARAGDIPMGAPRVTVITVRCTKGSCTDGAGEGETTLTFDDGTRSIVGWGYGG